MIKRFGKNFLSAIFEWQVRRLRARNTFSLIAVGGSVGKTSTKLAIARVLIASGRNVQYQEGNYNDRLTVPLVIFGHKEPALFNIFAWVYIIIANQAALLKRYPFDSVVVEIGTDGPGQIEKFAYLAPDIGVLTAVQAEHMEFFGSLDAVAEEELKIAEFSQQLLVNIDDTAEKYRPKTAFFSYGFSSADYQATDNAHDRSGQTVRVCLPHDTFDVRLAMLGRQGAKAALAAAAVAHKLGVTTNEIKEALTRLKPFAGRMQLLSGVRETTIIDDTYNASPVAVRAALDVLYEFDAAQRIAILGSMNELGESSNAEHKAIGAYCDPKKLDCVVTIGKQANEYIAPVAKEKGCEVKACNSPYEAGEYVKSILKNNAVVLAKGSQNGVFAEEALKALLANDADQSKLVRQSSYWLRQKQHQFAV